MEITEIVKENLTAIGENYDVLKPFMQNWLVKVEESIQKKKTAQKDAEVAIKSIDYSVKAIAADIGASRTTIYNHEQLLKRYIEHSTVSASASSPYGEIGRLQNEQSILKEQISKLMLRDVDIEILRMQNRTLANTLEGKNSEIQRLEARVQELSTENQKLKANKPAGTVTPIAFKKK